MNDNTERVVVTGGILMFSIFVILAAYALGPAHISKGRVLYPNAKGTIHPKYPLPPSDTQAIFEVKGTFYNPVAHQCDKTPLETADGRRINLRLLKKEKIRWVALSRDLLKRWNGPFQYGDTLYVFHHSHKIRGMWIIHDSMNARFRKRIDFLRYGKSGFPGVANNILISNKPFYNER